MKRFMVPILIVSFLFFCCFTFMVIPNIYSADGPSVLDDSGKVVKSWPSKSAFLTDPNVRTERLYCDKCGKCITYKDKFTLSVDIAMNPPFDPVLDVGLRNFYQKQAGNYTLDKVYRFCWECFLDALFGKKQIL